MRNVFERLREMITVIDYGMGNLSSVINAIKRYTAEVRISAAPRDIFRTDKLVLPGVGAFKNAYDEIERRKLFTPILDFIDSGKPFMGICLGLQLLFTKSYEGGEHRGFGIIEGKVVEFPRDKGLKIPHMGWNSITYNLQLKTYNCPLLQGIPDGAHMYFVHSFYVKPKDETVIAATTDYGVNFCSFLWRKNIYAMQFHPEKSQKNGLKMIENFVSL